MQSKSLSTCNLNTQVSFSGTNRLPISSLKSFQKHHRLPVGDAASRLRFPGQLARADISADLDDVFGRLRKSFGFKRREMTVEDPVDGCASIRTPALTYTIEAALDDADERMVVWRRFVSELEQLETLFQDPFQAVFGNQLPNMHVELSVALDIESVIDHLEEIDGDCRVEYDRTATWCQVETADTPVVMRMQGRQITVHGKQPLRALELIEGYWFMQQRFLESLDVPG